MTAEAAPEQKQTTSPEQDAGNTAAPLQQSQPPAAPTATEPTFVLGVDFGTDNAVLTLTSTKTAKPDILRNDLSKQSTPICVAFNGRERSFGAIGLQLETTHKDNTLRAALRGIGKAAEEFAALAPWSAGRVSCEGDAAGEQGRCGKWELVEGVNMR